MADNFRKNPGDEEGYKFDPLVHAATQMSHQHRMHHDGFMFHTSGKVTGLVDDGVHSFLLAIPASTFPHVQSFKLAVGKGDIDVTIYEGTATSSQGSVLTSFVTNRNSTNTASTVVTFSPTVTGAGTLLHTGWIPPTATGIGQSVDGVVTQGPGEEWILKPSTQYGIFVHNGSGATVDYRWELLWYEAGYEH